MHQSERVSSTSGNDHLDNNDNHQNNNDEDSDMDSWPEDTTSPNDSKDTPIINFLMQKVHKIKYDLIRFLL